jgi:glyoxylase-like metal-dependent hydrolase (beta-lactamase superfamily II)
MRYAAASIGLILLAASPARAETPAGGAAVLRRAAARLGLDELERRGFVQLTFEGAIDESSYMQGLEPDRTDVRQTFGFDLSRDAVGWESKGLRGDGSVRWRRFTYPEPDLRLVVELTEKWASPVRSQAWREERLRTARFLPHLLVREALRRLPTVRPLPGGAGVSYATAGGDVLDLRFGDDGLLARVETWLAIPFLGDRRCAWEYSNWRRENGVALPGRRRVLIGEAVAEDLSLKKIEWVRDGGSIFDLPADVRRLPERTGAPVLADAALGQAAPKSVAAGIWFAVDLSPGFHGMFAEHADGVTALEAPAGTFFPRSDIPPANLVRGARSSAVGEAFVDVIRKALPGRPLRRLVVSHPHADHAGGVRAFAAEGAEIVVGEGASPSIERFLAERFTLEPDRFEAARARMRPKVHVVRERETVGEGAARLDLIPVAGNPHSAGMLVSWFPEARVMFQGDLFYPEPLAGFPSPNRLPVMAWFVDWMSRTGIDPERIYSTHGDQPATREHLDKLRALHAKAGP